MPSICSNPFSLHAQAVEQLLDLWVSAVRFQPFLLTIALAQGDKLKDVLMRCLVSPNLRARNKVGKQAMTLADGD